MAKTLGQKLDDVQAAIEAVEGSQSYKMNGREMTRADLSTLYKREDHLEHKIETLGRNYVPGQNINPRRMSAPIQFS